MKIKNLVMILTLGVVTMSCAESPKQETKTNYADLTKQYAKVQLTSDISHLSDNEKQMLDYLYEIGNIMDDIFWTQNFGGDKETFLNSIQDEDARLFAEINYGPWNHFDNLTPFLPEYDSMPQGAGFYPVDMTKEEFEAWDNADKTSQYTLIKRDENGQLQSVWFHDAYAEQINRVADLLNKAADLAGDEEFANYLRLRAKAVLTDDYFESDMAWMDVRNNNVDFVVGPIENYVDAL